MKTLSFELTMPNVGSWNGKWTGADKKYYVIRKYADKILERPHFVDLLKDGKDSWYYSWGDGWGANVRVEIVDNKEAAKRRKISKGFCGYEWMIDTIVSHGKILTSTEKQTS